MTLKDVLLMIWTACIVAMIIAYFCFPSLLNWLADQKGMVTSRERIAYVILVFVVGVFITAGGVIVSIIKKGG